MKAIGIFLVKLAVFAGVYLCWRWVADRHFVIGAGVAVVWGGIAVVPLVGLAARWLLNRKPTPQRAALLLVPVHALELILLGCGLIVGFPLMRDHPWMHVPLPRVISQPLVEIFGVLAFLAVLNLAARGLGLPFAAVLSRKLATDWLYARCRNPMGLMTLLCCLAGAAWLQSLHALVWVVCWLSPAWILYVKLYEERELEVRFGTPYLDYRAKTPFFLGRASARVREKRRVPA